MTETRTVDREKGVTAPVVAAGLVALVGFAGLTVDVGYWYHTRSQLQSAADGAALGAAMELDGTPGGIARARLRAQDLAGRYVADARPLALSQNAANASNGDIVIGTWAEGVGFKPLNAPAATPLLANAVKVEARRWGSVGGAVSTYFVRAVGGPASVDIGARAVAVAGGPSSDCGFPLAVASCQIVDTNGAVDQSCGKTFYFRNDVNDNIAFTNLAPTPPVSTSVLRELLQRFNGGECLRTGIGENITVNNGNFLGALQGELRDVLGTGPATVEIPVIDAPCPPKYNQSYPVVGLATFTINRVVPPPGNYIEATMNCGVRRNAPGGGPMLGTKALQPRLVQ